MILFDGMRIVVIGWSRMKYLTFSLPLHADFYLSTVTDLSIYYFNFVPKRKLIAVSKLYFIDFNLDIGKFERNVFALSSFTWYSF